MTDNVEQIKYWNGQAGETWVQARERIDRTLALLSDILVSAANPVEGERVIDVGCGCGTTTLALAERGAAVWGIDISSPMLDYAKARVRDSNNPIFSKTDAATEQYTPDHDLIFSRFGVMFFSDPIAAFTNLRTAMTENGRLVFLCWQKPSSNPWMSVAGAAIQPFLPQPSVAPDPRAPGPFAFADTGYIETIINGAGFSELEIDPVSADVHLGMDVEEAMSFQSQIGPLSRALAELEGDDREVALAAAREALLPHVDEGGLILKAAAFLVTARR